MIWTSIQRSFPISRRARALFLTLVVAMAAVHAPLRAQTSDSSQESKVDRLFARWERDVDKEPDYITLSAIKRHFPADFAKFKARLREAYLRKTSQNFLSQLANSVVPEIGLAQVIGEEIPAFADMINDIINRDDSLLWRADPIALDRFNALKLEEIRHLRTRSPMACVKRALSQPIADIETTSSEDDAINRALAAQIDALGSGVARTEEIPEPGAEEGAAFDARLHELAAGEQLYASLKRGADVPAEEAGAQCDLFIAAYRAVAAMPQPARAGLIAYEFVRVLGR